MSWTIIDSLFSHNRAIGNGANPAQAGTPGGGSGGAIYNDGNTMTLALCGDISQNVGGSWYPVYPQSSHHADTPVLVTSSTIE